MKFSDIQLEELKKAVERLKESLALPKTDITRDSSIQRFEFTIELSWKVLQKYLKAMGVADPLSPKAVIREGARLNLVDDPETWLHFIDQRNLSSHTYKEALAEQVLATAQKVPAFVERLIKNLEKEI